MAILALSKLRPLIVVAAVGATMLVSPALASAAPGSTPSINSLQKQLGQLAVKNSQLVEKYNQARIDVTQTSNAAKAAQASATRAAHGYEAARVQYVRIVQSQYEGSSMGAAGALLQSSSDANYLDRLGSLNMVSNHVSQVVEKVATVRKRAAASEASANTLAASATSRRDMLVKQRKNVDAKIAQYKDELATLTSAQRVDYQRAQNPAVSSQQVTKTAQQVTKTVKSLHLTKAGSAAAIKAANFALAQVGKPYVFGAAGPGSFDCSGLTMRAWQAGGVSLPHSAADQYNYGTHVSRDQLQPGDLVFLYSPIGHVAIYIGDGMMVSAPTEGENVSVVPLGAFNGDYVGATRLT